MIKLFFFNNFNENGYYIIKKHQFHIEKYYRKKKLKNSILTIFIKLI